MEVPGSQKPDVHEFGRAAVLPAGLAGRLDRDREREFGLLHDVLDQLFAADKRVGSILSPADIVQVSAVTLGSLGLLVAATATGHFADWLFLWFIPTRLGILILNIFFQWLPHHPFDRTDRYHNTRLSLWPGGTFLTLQQNLHLMHHLWPSVPFYNYARLYRALRPLLVAEGVRIEGLMVGSQVRPRRTVQTGDAVRAA